MSGTLPDPETRRLRAYRPVDPGDPPEGAQAAVAALVRGGGEGPELLLMLRAERPGDRWSGQVALPGGRAEPEDADLVATAVRETREEVGVELERAADLLCRLERLQAMARGRPVPLCITPYVFGQRAEPTVELGPEAADAFWLPLGPAARGELDGTHRYEDERGRFELPAWHHEGHVVWGMTYRIVGRLMRLLELAPADVPRQGRGDGSPTGAR